MVSAELDRSGVADLRIFLIADVRGYTRFTVEHGDAAAARLATKFATLTGEVVAERDGELLELRGDEALAVFASARQALWAAADLQERVVEHSAAQPELAMKIGVGLDAGEAIPVDGGYRGTALNLAARLCSLAGGGEILASDTVISLARKLEGLEYLERGMVPLKGFTDPVRVMQVTASMALEDRPEDKPLPLPIGGFLGALPAGPLAARDHELRRVLGAVDAVAAGSGQLLLLAGEPGAGKTRLAQEVTLHARNREFTVASGSCYEARQSVPYYPFLDALATLYGAASPATRSLVPLRWPHLGRLLPEAGIGTATVDSDGQQEQERLFRAVAGFLQTVAETDPVALFLDDLHWADTSSLELLRHLAKHTRGHRVLILATYRDVEVGRQHPLEEAVLDLTREQLVERIPIRRLDREGTAALIAAILGEEEVTEEFVNLVHERTEGNAFFTQEVLRAMVERGDVFRKDGIWDRRAVEEIEVPESVRAVIGRRVSRLEEESQELLHEASALGTAFAFDDLQAMSGRSEDETENALEEGIAAGLIREVDGDHYAFNHALTQQALYSELSSRRKRRLHLAAGEAIEAIPERKRKDREAELAWHFLEGDDPARALRHSLAAGDRAQAVFAHSEAQKHFQSAVDLAAELEAKPQLAQASFKFADALLAAGDLDATLPLFERAMNLYADLDDPVGEGRAAQRAAFIHDLKRREESSAAYFARAKSLIDRVALCPPTREQVDYYQSQSMGFLAGGDLLQSLGMAERAVEAARALADVALITRAELERATKLGLVGQVHDAISVAEEVMPRVEASGDLESLYRALSNLAEYSMIAGLLERSRAYRLREYEALSRLGRAFETAFSLGNLAQIHLYLGEWEAAYSYAQQGLAQGEAMGMGFVSRFARMVLGHLALARGDWEEARSLLEKAADDATGTLQMGRYAHRGLAQLDLKMGRAEAAVRRLEPLVEGADPNDNDIVFLLPVLAQSYIEAGDIESGSALAERVVAQSQENALARVDALAVLGMALSRQGRLEEAARAFDESVTLAHRMPYPYVEAIALELWGIAGGSRERLEQARAIFQRLGARKDIEQIQRDLSSMA